MTYRGEGSHSFKLNFLAFVLTTALAVATPEFARAEGGMYFKFEGRGVFSDGDEFPYAYQNGSDTTHEIELDASFAGKVGIGARFGSAWDIGLLYSGLRATGNTAAFRDAPLGTFASNALFPLVNAYGGGTTYFQSTDASSEQTYHVVDFEVGYTMKLGSADVRLIAGVRYADFLRKDSSTMAWNNTAGTLPYVGVFGRTNDNWGIGPRLGLEFAQPLGSGGVQLTGAISGSALFGERETTDSYLFDGNLTGVLPSLNTYNAGGDDFYNAEGEIGLSYGVELGNARNMIITLGYRAEAWFDVNNTRSTNPVVPPQGSTGADEFFHGPVLKGTLNF